MTMPARGVPALAAALAARELRAEDLWRACLEAIDERESAVQAFAHLDAEAVLREARALDAGPVRGPLHGLPLGVKDVFDTFDQPTAYGSPVWTGHRPRADAAAVAVCRAAGALVAGKTVTTEFATLEPAVTRNPHDPSRTPGGSSSGSAAAVAAGMLPLAIGTQTGGSVIRPAAYCGVVGFKPTLNRIARAGMKLQSDTLDTIGAFARSVPDVAWLAAVLLRDEALRVAGAGTPPARLALFRGPDDARAEPALQALAEAVATKAAAADLPAPPWFAALGDLNVAVNRHEGACNLRWEHQHHAAQLSARLRAMLEAGDAISGAEHAAHLAAVDAARRRVDELFGPHELLLTFSATGEAGAWEAGTGDPVFCRPWTTLGLPCLHLPLAGGPHGLPIGLQLVGRAGDDARVLHAGAWLHERLRG